MKVIALILILTLKAGDPAPLFSALEASGKTFSLKEALKQHNVALFFLRYIGCAFCQVMILNVKKRENIFKSKNILPVFVINSERKVVTKYLEKIKKPNFVFIPDPALTLYKKYDLKIKGGVKSVFSANVFKKFFEFLWKDLKNYKGVAKGLEGAHYLLPACFGINTDGEIVYAHYGKDIADSCKLDELLEAF